MSDLAVLGVDVGTTSAKAAAFDLDGRILAEGSVPTRWDVGPGGETDIDADALADDVIGLLAKVASECGSTVVGIGITGMAETGVIVDAHGRPRHKAFAWFDQRGAEELQALPQQVRDEFSGVTGLALKAECSLSKVLWLRSQGFEIGADEVWLNAQEYIGFRLTSVMATEPSLASRTAFWDQSGEPWSAALDLLGATGNFIPPFVNAGTSLGPVTDAVPRVLHGAAVTVTGHDHVVGAVGSGAVAANQLFNSCGTADVLVRTVPWELSVDERARLVAGGLSTGRHVLPGRVAVLGATRFGLVLERVLAMLGFDERDERARLMDAWQPDSGADSVVTVSEPGGWINEVTVSLHDRCGPEQVVAAAIDYGLMSMRSPVATLESVTGSAGLVTAGGGWAQIDGVLRAKASLFTGLERSSVVEPGVRGAAAFAGIAADHTNHQLTRDLAGQLQTTSTRENQ